MYLFTLVTLCIFADQIAIRFDITVPFTLGHINMSLQNEYINFNFCTICKFNRVHFTESNRYELNFIYPNLKIKGHNRRVSTGETELLFLFSVILTR